MNITAIIPAGGIGKRFDSSLKKQFFMINGKPIIYYTLKKVHECNIFKEIIVGVSQEDELEIKDIASQIGIKNIKLSRNGDFRVDTVLNALQSANTDYVAIHDAVRPFITKELIMSVVKNAISNDGAICGIYPRDTIKIVNKGLIEKTIDRNQVFLAHTPQAFHKDTLIQAIHFAKKKNIEITDESSAFEIYGRRVTVVESSSDNIKITEKNDLQVVNMLMSKYFDKIDT